MTIERKTTPLWIMGSNGASKEAYYIFKESYEKDIYDFKGFVEKDEALIGTPVTDGKVVGLCDRGFGTLTNKYNQLAVIIPFGDVSIKKKVFENLRQYTNIIYPTIIHNSCIQFGKNEIGQGNIISAGVTIACDVKIGSFNLLNRNCTIGHDVIIGSFNTINPMGVVSGNVNIGDSCLIGSNATVLQELTVSSGTVLGAGAVLTKSTNEAEVLVGIPAKSMKE